MHTEIYVAFHKEFPMLSNNSIYFPLHVGKALSDSNLGIKDDFSGDNISAKNKSFSELTGLYWIWKNTYNNVVGLCHYRRFFMFQKPTNWMILKKSCEYLVGQGKKRNGTFYSKNFQHSQLILTGDQLHELMENYDLILPQPRQLKYTVWEQYNRRHIISDLKTVKSIVETLYPDYSNEFDNVMNQKELCPCNMLIIKRPLFDSYCKWLFSILFKLEEELDISTYDSYQYRIFGFISERLINVWCNKQSLNIKKLPVLYFK